MKLDVKIIENHDQSLWTKCDNSAEGFEAIISQLKTAMERAVNLTLGDMPYPFLLVFRKNKFIEQIDFDFSEPIIATQIWVQLSLSRNGATHLAYLSGTDSPGGDGSSTKRCFYIKVVSSKLESTKLFQIYRTKNKFCLKELEAQFNDHLDFGKELLPKAASLEGKVNHDSRLEDFSTLICDYVKKFGDLRQPFIMAVNDSEFRFLAKVPTETIEQFNRKARNLVTTDFRAECYFQAFTAYSKVREGSTQKKIEVLMVFLFTKEKSLVKTYRIKRKSTKLNLEDIVIPVPDDGLFANSFSNDYAVKAMPQDDSSLH